MGKTILVGISAGFAAFAGAMIIAGNPLQAADEIRCRVNAEALLADIAKLSRPVDANEIKRLLKAP